MSEGRTADDPQRSHFENWEQVAAFALGLPGAESGTSYGKPAIKVGGKGFVHIGREAGSFAVHSPLEEKELLIETDPETFWESDHYRGWPTVLARYGGPAAERIETVIRRAWWDRTTALRRKAYGPRP